MNKIQKVVCVIVCTVLFTGALYCVVETAKQSNREIQPNYYRGIVIDKGVDSGRRSSYRWIIADWTTADGLHIGRHEINAAGQAINKISVGDTIYANGSPFPRWLFWWPIASGTAYYPSQISIFSFLVSMLVQFGLWILVIYEGYKLWKLR